MQVFASNLAVLEDKDERLTLETAHGLTGRRPGKTSSTADMIAAVDSLWLFVIKNAVIQQMCRVFPEVAAATRWPGGDDEGVLPPNFMLMPARQVEPLGPVFVRVTLEGEEVMANANASSSGLSEQTFDCP